MSNTLEAIILVLLILTNGFLAMAEIAVVSASKARLRQKSNEGSPTAAIALDLAENPNRFLSTIQIGISLVAVLSGAFGGASFGREVADLIAQVALLERYSQVLGYAVVVITITYASLIFGELVPKRIALSNPAGVAMLVAPPMRLLSTATYPIVRLLSLSTGLVIRLLRIDMDTEPPITEDEIRLLVAEGTRAGVFDPAERDLLHQILRLDELHVDELMTPRPNIVWLNAADDWATINQQMYEGGFSYFPVYEERQDNIQGIVSAKAVWGRLEMGQSLEWDDLLQEPLFIPENTQALQALKIFGENQRRIALVIDEYGTIQGLVSLTDILHQILGNILSLREKERHIAQKTQRADGSWLMDGILLLDELETIFDIEELPQREKDDYQTVGGFVMAHLDRVPRAGDVVEINGLRIEVMDMDGKRVDKVLVQPMQDAG